MRAARAHVQRLSVCMIARDEEPNIGRALDSVLGFAFEVIVLDTGSTDRTIEIARGKGATVLEAKWTGDFSEARNRVIAAARGDWILSLDADEGISAEFRERWQAASQTTSADGLCVPIENIASDGSRSLSQSIRLFKNKRGYVYEGAIHEDVVASIRKAGKGVAFADLPIAHYGYTREEDARKGRRKRNLSMLEAQHQAQPTNPRYWHYLALEHVANDDPGKAIPLLTRLLDEQPHHELAGWSASLLAQGLEMSGERSRAWEAAARASQSHSGRVMGLLRLGELARSEGDPETPRWCAEQLLALDSVRTGVEQRHARALSLRAGGLWENGKRKEAVDEWLAAVRLFPSDGALADQYVRHMDALQGGVRGALEAMRAAPTLVVAAAAVGSFLRAGDPARARPACPLVSRANPLHGPHFPPCRTHRRGSQDLRAAGDRGKGLSRPLGARAKR